jgi:hypothetical protein
MLIGRSISMRVIDTYLFALMHVPARFSVERIGVASSALRFPTEQRTSAFSLPARRATERQGPVLGAYLLE